MTEAAAAATAAQWAADPQAAAAAVGAGIQAAESAAGWSWGMIATAAGSAALFLSRFVPGWGGIVANLAWSFFADRRARQADQVQAAALTALRGLAGTAPAAVQSALDGLPAPTAAQLRQFITTGKV